MPDDWTVYTQRKPALSVLNDATQCKGSVPPDGKPSKQPNLPGTKNHEDHCSPLLM